MTAIQNKYSVTVLVLGFLGLFQANLGSAFQGLHSAPSYKKVVDTCVRTYSDLLLLEEKTGNHEKSDELVDLLVGRLVRLDNYVHQLEDEYRIHATVAEEDIEYLARIFDFMEIVEDPSRSHVGFSSKINQVIGQIKRRLREIPIMPAKQLATAA